jgi:hypothetical protein
MTKLRLPLTWDGYYAMPQAERFAQAERWAELGFPTASNEEVAEMPYATQMEYNAVLTVWCSIVKAMTEARARANKPPREVKVFRGDDKKIIGMTDGKRAVTIERNADRRIEKVLLHD